MNPMDEAYRLCDELPTHRTLDLETVLVAGASGYIGGRLVPELVARGYRVRVMVRSKVEAVSDRWSNCEVVVADALNPESLMAAMDGVHTVFYLIHSMLVGPKSFADADQAAARWVRESAEQQGVKRIIYLGGLGDKRDRLSPHLSSRMAVADELALGSVPVTFLRAAIILGSGSASYEMVNHLIRRLWVLPVPGWAKTRCQPIALRDVIKILVGVLECPETAGKIYDIGGPDILSYEELLKTHAEVLGRRRIFPPSPLSSISFFAMMTSWLTPVPTPITRCLMESVEYDVVCEGCDVLEVLPFRRISCREALVLALSREEQDAVHSRWTDSYPPNYELAIKLNEISETPTYTSTYSLVTEKSAKALFESICYIGGQKGWFNSTPLWRVRGMIDRMFQGVGTRRGRRSPTRLRVNDVVDFWRVERVEKPSRLLLRAEMKLPGRAWLEFRVDPEDGVQRLSVHASYYTKGVGGRLYWYVFPPFHHFIFGDLIRGIEKRSEEFADGRI
jgi:uncharacterized protein YbjT (DUF2867 family)